MINCITLPADFAHIRLIRPDQVPPQVLLDAWESCRNELLTARASLKVQRDRMEAQAEEITYYRESLAVIARTRTLDRDPATLLRLACAQADRALLAYASRTKRTWRDRIAAWWTTHKAHKARKES